MCKAASGTANYLAIKVIAESWCLLSKQSCWTSAKEKFCEKICDVSIGAVKFFKADSVKGCK